MRVLRAAFAIVVYGHLSNAAPQILFPLNSQVPPVARASIPFTFTFAPSTFSTDLPNTYSLSNAPRWLSLDSETRTLSGTPTPGNADPKISIIASDDTGSVTMNSELVVRTTPAPMVQIPFESQAASFGVLSGPSTVLYYSSSDFKIRFSPGTFMENDSSTALSYYAVSQDNTPLPSWILFDAETLSFSGKTPDSHSLVQPTETFAIRLIASDVEGFAGAFMAFNIAVGNHQLAFDNAAIKVKGEGGKSFQYEGLSGDLKLDGEVIVAKNLTSINAQMPSWLAFDNSTFILGGVAPTHTTTCNVTVNAVDIYGDIANVLITIDFDTELFIGNLTQLNATMGEYFLYDITSFLEDPSDVVITTQFEPSALWLSFDANNMTIYGQVPTALPPSTVQIILQASSKTSSDTQSISIILNVISSIMGPSLSVTPSPSSTSSTSSDIHAPGEANRGSKKNLSKGDIAAIIISLLLLLLAVFSCIFWICCHRHNRRGHGARSPAKSDISGPVQVISPPHVPGLGASHQALSRPRPRRNQTIPADNFILDENPQRSRQSKSSAAGGSQTMNNLSATRTPHLAESHNSENRGRSLSENTSSDWRTESTQISNIRTQDSAFPHNGSQSNSNRATRNFSRKGGAEQLQREDTSNLALYMGLSTNSRNSSIQQTPEHNYDPMVYLLRNQSFQYAGTLIHEDHDEFESGPSEGLDQGGLSRSTSSWFTDLSAGGDRAKNRDSVCSAQTQDTNLLFDSLSLNKYENRRSIRIVPTSPQPPSQAPLSAIEAPLRTVYKPSRSNEGGVFFGGGSRCGSRSSSRMHRSLSMRSGYTASLYAYSNINSLALPLPILTKWNEENSKALSAIQHPKRGPPTMQQSSIEKMVSAAGLRFDNDTPDQIIGLGIGHGRVFGGSSNKVRHSFLSNISSRLSRTLQSRNSKQSFNGNETDTENQFQVAEEDGTPRKSPCGNSQHVSPLHHTTFHSNNESEDSGHDYEDKNSENSITEEYIRNSLTSSYAATQGCNNRRTSFTTRWSNGVPIEYSQDEESPTLGQGTLGEIQRVVIQGKNSRDGSLMDRGDRVPNSPMVVSLKERVVALRDKVGPSSRGGLGLGSGLELRDNENARIIGERPERIEVSGKGGPGNGNGLGIYKKTWTSARYYEFGEDVNDENAAWDGDVIESGSSAFL